MFSFVWESIDLQIQSAHSFYCCALSLGLNVKWSWFRHPLWGVKSNKSRVRAHSWKNRVEYEYWAGRWIHVLGKNRSESFYIQHQTSKGNESVSIVRISNRSKFIDKSISSQIKEIDNFDQLYRTRLCTYFYRVAFNGSKCIGSKRISCIRPTNIITLLLDRIPTILLGRILFWPFY